MRDVKLITFQMIMVFVLLLVSSCDINKNSINTVVEVEYSSVTEAGMDTVPPGTYSPIGPFNNSFTIDYGFEIMQYEVTNGQYVTYLREALAEGLITVNDSTVMGYFEGDNKWNIGPWVYLAMDRMNSSISYTDNIFTITPGYEDHPVVYVTWFGANGFATYYNMQIPTNEEWEIAARGNTGCEYAWGNTLDMRRANYGNSGDPFDNGTTPVGFYNGSEYDGFETIDSSSPFGAYDMCGNVWEWTNTYAGISSYRTIRGGSYTTLRAYMLSTHYFSLHYPNEVSSVYGFRLIRKNVIQ